MMEKAHEQSTCTNSKMKKKESHRSHFDKGAPHSELWTDGLICAFEFVKGCKKSSPSRPCLKGHHLHQNIGLDPKKQVPLPGMVNSSNQTMTRDDSSNSMSLIELSEATSVSEADRITHKFLDGAQVMEKCSDNHWVPIGWARISELVQTVQVDADWTSRAVEFNDDEDDVTVADLATPYWERPAGPTWWCHVVPGHQPIDSWLSNAQWLHPAISIALRDENRLISERMKHLLYEVPVRVAGGLLFELLGQSVGDPFCDEDDIPIVLRSWQAQNFLITALHVKGSASNINVLGITEVQELLLAGGYTSPKSVHEVVAHLVCRLSRWDDRLFRKFVFGAADEIELKFVHRRNHEDLNLLSIILNQEIRRLSTQVIRVKWSLHAREEIVFELLQHLRGYATKSLLEGVWKSSREMIEEQEAVRGRLFTIQDVMQSTVRAWLQDKSLRVTHNLAIFGGCGLVLSIITSLFGINVDGIPGAQDTPYAFGLFTGILFFLGIILIGLGIIYLGLKRPISEKDVHIRKLELQQLVSMFQHDAETHAKVREHISRHNLPPTAADMIPAGTDYILID
ncbi:hypothetical protein QJS10_CPB14g00540 [Acorus calamus]|uniref:Magnesium transporter CorA-like family protein n=1 Tax=Acorus calamus TaxID=4465 RepID=A0AAV9DA84_ACOCL|nr:hypothetical protein QJS10_CPB14g00540 [Acorus calamus]